MKWLEGILERMKAMAQADFTAQEDDQDEVGADDKVLGTISPELYKLHLYVGHLIDIINAKMRAHKESHESPDHTEEMCEKFHVELAPLKEEVKILGMLKWRETREELKITASNIGIRKGGVVVELPEEEENPLGGLGIFGLGVRKL